MDAIEQTFCRAPLARAFNRMPQGMWISNINISFSKKFGRDTAFSASSDYESGSPDGYGIWMGRIVCVECKAAFGKFVWSQWTSNQRTWYMRKCRPTRTPYYVAIFLGEDRAKREGEIYMIPGAKMISGVHKSMTARQATHLWPSYRLDRDGRDFVVSESLWRN